MITALLGIIVLCIMAIPFLLALWHILEIAYRVTMIVIYATLYVLVSLWDAFVWIILVPFRFTRWVCRAIGHE